MCKLMTDGDFILKPDFTTLRKVPWYSEPTAQIICDAVDNKGNEIEVYSFRKTFYPLRKKGYDRL